jgi:hypothetical protein
MGGITDHAFEHLVPKDQTLVCTPRRVLPAALALRGEGTLPPGVRVPEVMWDARSGSLNMSPGLAWQEA